MNALRTLRQFLDRDYRDGYLRTQVGSGIAYQIQALRAKLGLTQVQFAKLIGKPQTVVSRLENGTGNVSVETLLDVATGAGVALLVQFVSYPEMLRRTEDMTVTALQPNTIAESVADLERLANASAASLSQWGMGDRAPQGGGGALDHFSARPADTDEPLKALARGPRGQERRQPESRTWVFG